MDITAAQGFRILADAIQDHRENVTSQLKAEADALERRDWPYPETEIFRAKAEFFRRYIEGQAAAINKATDNLQAAQLEHVVKSLNFKQTSELP